MATITALNVRLGMDASNFSQGADLARSEVNRVASVMRQSTPPAEKFKRDVELLNKAFSESGKKTKAYADAMEHLRKKYGQVDPAAKKAFSSIEQMKQSMLSAVPGGHMLTNALKGPAGALLALGAAAAVAIRGMSQAATRIDETAKAARSLGFAYRDLVAIQMLAGEVAGIDASSVNRGLGQFVKRLAEARVDGGKLKETMVALGLDVDKLAASDPADAFKAVSTAIAGVPDKVEQIRIATLLVGKEGVKMVELFRQGGEAVDAMTKEAERLGTVVSDAAAGEIEAMNDALGRSKMAAEGIWNTMLSGVAPTMKNVAKLTEEMLVAIRNIVTQSESLLPIFNAIGFVVNKLIDGLRAIIAVVSDMMSMLGSLPGMLTGGKLNTEFSESSRLLDEIEARAMGVKTATEQASEAAEALAIETERAEDAAKKQEESFQKRLLDLKIEQIALSGNVELAERMRLQSEGYSESQINALRTMQQQNDAIKERIAAEKKAAEDARKAAAQQAKDNQKRLDDSKKKMEEVQKAFTVEVSSAIKAAKDYFAAERQRDNERRKAASQGPSSIEVGSAESAKFRADMVNQRIGAAAVPDKPTPGEAQIVQKAAALLAVAEASKQVQQSQVNALGRLLAARHSISPSPGFEKLLAARQEAMKAEADAAAAKIAEGMRKPQQRQAEAVEKAAQAWRAASTDDPFVAAAERVAESRFVADQTNARIGAAAVPVKPTPGEKAIADKTRELLIEQRKANAAQEEELKTMKALLVQFKENGFKRIR